MPPTQNNCNRSKSLKLGNTVSCCKLTTPAIIDKQITNQKPIISNHAKPLIKVKLKHFFDLNKQCAVFVYVFEIFTRVFVRCGVKYICFKLY